MKNVYGWSSFSPITYILAARVPDAPPRPTFISATDNSITLQLYKTTTNVGAFTQSYTLEMDQGSTDSAFSEVTSYVKTSFAMTHTVTFATDGIVTGNIYTFRFYATNEKGSSDYSEYLSVAAIDPPGQANAPIVNYNLSSRNSIFVSWVLNSDGLGDGGAIQGYKLYMDDGYGGELKVVFDTVGYSSQINEFLAVNLTASL